MLHIISSYGIRLPAPVDGPCIHSSFLPSACQKAGCCGWCVSQRENDISTPSRLCQAENELFLKKFFFFFATLELRRRAGQPCLLGGTGQSIVAAPDSPSWRHQIVHRERIKVGLKRIACERQLVLFKHRFLHHRYDKNASERTEAGSKTHDIFGTANTVSSRKP